jgi:phosphohistidine phosphatase SixA
VTVPYNFIRRSIVRLVQVFLIRHAEATERGIRGLSALGKTQAACLGERLRWHDCEPTQIWASPLERAAETARIVRGELGGDAELEILEDLAHGGDPRVVVKAVRALPAGSLVVLVGHEPGLSLIGADLTRVTHFPSLARGQAARIVDGVLKWRFAWDADAPVSGG